MFAGENDGDFPVLQNVLPGFRDELLGPDMRQLYPDYLNDPAITICPSDPGVESVAWGQVALPMEEGVEEIQALISSGQATGDCMISHLSYPRSYIYFGFATLNPTVASEAWYCYEEAAEELRNQHDIEQFRLDLGQECPYNEAFYDDDGQTITGMFAVDKEQRWQAGVDAGVLTSNGDAYFGNLGRQYLIVGVGPDGRWQYADDYAYRIRESIERFFITDINNPGSGMAAQSSIPVMMDGWGVDRKTSDTGGTNAYDDAAAIEQFNHVPGGSNVLYMDGHVEFVRYDSKHPVKIGEYGAGKRFYGGNVADGLSGP
jgi:prepilin-type processing-associated H-X9-DG protein